MIVEYSYYFKIASRSLGTQSGSSWSFFLYSLSGFPTHKETGHSIMNFQKSGVSLHEEIRRTRGRSARFGSHEENNQHLEKRCSWHQRNGHLSPSLDFPRAFQKAPNMAAGANATGIGCDSSFLLPPCDRSVNPPRRRAIETREIVRQLADLSLSLSLFIPSTISSLVGPFDRSSRSSRSSCRPPKSSYIAEQVRKARWSTLRRKAKPQPLLARNVWSPARTRYIREDWFHERLPRARPARLLRGR